MPREDDLLAEMERYVDACWERAEAMDERALSGPAPIPQARKVPMTIIIPLVVIGAVAGGLVLFAIGFIVCSWIVLGGMP